MATEAPTPCPFVRRSPSRKPLKILVYGASGSGKTRFALTFPDLAVIDTERGMDHYNGNHAISDTRDPDEVRRWIDWLARNRHGFSSLAIDSLTVVWEAIQRKWSDRILARSSGRRPEPYEFAALGPREWMTIKSDFRDLVQRIQALDMHVVCTCRAKTEKDETTYDADRGLDYAFDVVIELWRTGGKTYARQKKDRTGRIPQGTFELTPDFLEQAYPRLASGEGARANKAKPTERREETHAVR